MKKIIFSIFLLTVLVFSKSVLSDSHAKISNILLYEGGNLVYVYLEGGVQNPPACHGANGDYLSFKMDRPMAKEYLSALMMAFAADKKVFFRTERNCVDQSVSDTIQYFRIDK
jgi:hypothetical protein